jgi:DNA-binding transcriptional regulator LsrR (DeoR family)
MSGTSGKEENLVTADVGPAHLVLTATVARRYYLDGKSKIEIADELKLSRFKVARLLETARSSGLVRIDIGHPGEIDVVLSSELRDAYQLQHAIVVDTLDEDDAALRQQVGLAAAELLTEIVTTDDVLGLGWARSLMAMRAELTQLASCPVVQLTGALSRPDVDESSIELVRDVARIAKGPAYYFYAPMIVPDATTAQVLLRQPEVARAIEQFSSVTKAVVGIGSWDPPYSTVYDAISAAERAKMVRLGVRGDVSGVLLDAHGQAVTAPLTQRMIGIDAVQMRRIPEVIGLAYGNQKAAAARAAILGGYVSGLVTHTSFARTLLGLAGR